MCGTRAREAARLVAATVTMNFPIDPRSSSILLLSGRESVEILALFVATFQFSALCVVAAKPGLGIPSR